MRLSAVHGSNIIMESLSFLGKSGAGFAVHGSQVKILTQPSQFYEELCKRAASAQNRIVMASLYLGTGEKEKELIESVRKSLERTEGKLRVNVLLDYCRGNRDVKGANSCTVLAPILEKYKDSCNISLYHTPALRGFWKAIMPDRYNETIGLQHCKIYVFDDSFIISGANLSQDYFTNRQDRYVIIEGCPKLADYYENLSKEISEFSFKVDFRPNEKEKIKFSLSDRWTGGHPYKGNFDTFVKEVKKNISNFLTKQKNENSLVFAGNSFDENCKSSNNEECDTWIFPSVQMGAMGVTHDSELTTQLLENAPKDSLFKFGTGYFNLTQEYLHVIMHKSRAKFDLVRNVFFPTLSRRLFFAFTGDSTLGGSTQNCL